MKKSLLVVGMAAAAALAGAGCKKEPQVVPTPPPVTVATPAPAPKPTPTPVPPEDEYTKVQKMSPTEIEQYLNLADVHFDYDRHELREGDRTALRGVADKLKKFDFVLIKVQGHCDERGSVDYNLSLGDKRAKAVKEYLESLGIASARLTTTSLGKEVPLCTQKTEECWARNRRGHFTVSGKK